MKRELALTGIALLVSVLLSSPAMAQIAPKPANVDPAPTPIETVALAALEDLSIDDAILMASTPQERAMVLRRCAGPPPRMAAKVEPPASKPAVVAD